MSTVREMWGAASVLMDYWNRLSDDREEVSEDEFVSRMAALPDGTRTDMELVVLGMHLLKAALATFDPDQWADEAKTQAAIAVWSIRVKQETDRANRAQTQLNAIQAIVDHRNLAGNLTAVLEPFEAIEKIRGVLR